MKRLFVIIALCFLALSAYAQESAGTNSGIRFFVRTGVTYAMNSPGENIFSSQIPTPDLPRPSNVNINAGFAWYVIPKLSLGAGIGIENYNSSYANGYPFFAEGKCFLFDSANTPFIYGLVGTMINGSGNVNSQKGNMADIGIGYKLKLVKIISLNITAGYSYKELKRIYINGYTGNLLSFGVGVEF
jgi:hypothetical protein